MNKKIFYLPLLIFVLPCCSVNNAITRKNAPLLTKELDSLSEMEFVMEEGALIDEQGGMKFRSFIAKSDYDAMIEGGYYDISFGLVYTSSSNRNLIGDLSLENIFTTQSPYTLDKNNTSKILLNHVNATKKVEYNRVVLQGSILDIPIEKYDEEYMVTMYVQAYKFGMVSYAVAEQNNNDFSFVYLAQQSRDNIVLSDKQSEVIEKTISDYKDNKGGHPRTNYYLSTYIDGEFEKKESFTGEIDDSVEYEPTLKDGYSVQRNKSHLKSKIYANEKTELSVYYVSNPEYSIVYYTPNNSDTYVESYRIDGLSAKNYALINLSDEQILLPEGTIYGDDSIKDELSLNLSDSVLSGINDGNLVLKVYYSLPITEKDSMYILRDGNDFTLTAERGTSQSFGYKFFRKQSNTALISVKVPKELITDGGSNPIGGITLTNGNVTTEANVYRPEGSYISMDFGIGLRGLKSYNNLYTLKGRSADINTWGAQSIYYYDQVNYDNAPLINDKDRELTIALYDGYFYLYIDDVSIVKISPTNTSFFPAGFNSTDSFKFGIFVGCAARIGSKITLLEECYGESAIDIFKTNNRYQNIGV